MYLKEVIFIKKFISAISIAFLIIFSFSFTAFASENISFSLSDESIKPNRLVNIQLKAKSEKSLCAAIFEFTYNTDILDYRSVKVSDNESKIKANNKNGKIKVSYLNANGKKISNETEIFTITFKALKEGSCNIEFTASDCVDENINFIDVSSCKSAKINVSKNNSDTDDISNKSNSSDKTNAKSKTESNNKSIKETSKSSDKISSIDEWGEINPIADKNIKYIFIGIGIGAAFILLILLVFVLGRFSYARQHKNEKGDKP